MQSLAESDISNYTIREIARCVYRQKLSLPSENAIVILASAKAVVIDIELCSDEILDKLRLYNPDLLIGIILIQWLLLKG